MYCILNIERFAKNPIRFSKPYRIKPLKASWLYLFIFSQTSRSLVYFIYISPPRNRPAVSRLKFRK